MHLHILTSIEPKKFINSNIASDRLRLNYLYSAAKELGYNVTGSLNIQKNADIYYVGKINIDMIDKILEILSDLKRKNSRIIVDYTDDLLSSNNDQDRKMIYEELIKVKSCITVPVDGLGRQFQQKGKEVFVIPDGIDSFPLVKPSLKKNNEKNVLWHGHSSNINSLIRIISSELVKYKFNLHMVTNPGSFEILKKTKFNTVPNCKPIGYLWSIENLIIASHKCDFAIIPASKQWASANRLITNFRLGLPVIAEKISSYREFSNFFCEFEERKIIKMFDSPESWHNSIISAQDYIENKFSEYKLINLWKKILT